MGTCVNPMSLRLDSSGVRGEYDRFSWLPYPSLDNARAIEGSRIKLDSSIVARFKGGLSCSIELDTERWVRRLVRVLRQRLRPRSGILISGRSRVDARYDC